MVALAATQRVSCVPVKSLTAHPQLEVQAKRLCVLFSTTKESTLFNMSSTSMKHRNFVSEPMGDKPATDLAGIGETLSKRLASKGYDKVSVLSSSSFHLHLHLTLMFISISSSTGIYYTWPIPGIEERPRAFRGVAQGNLPSEFKASQRLFSMPE